MQKQATTVQITTTSPKGQVVIPQSIREQMNISSGTKFAVYGRGDTLIFKRVALPTVKDFERLALFGRGFAARKGIKEKDVLEHD
jgi:AbrB family looped-hinge helix DNA binding protein